MIFQMKTIEKLWFLEIDQSSFKNTVPVTQTLLAYRLQLYQPHVIFNHSSIDRVRLHDQGFSSKNLKFFIFSNNFVFVIFISMSNSSSNTLDSMLSRIGLVV